MYNIPKQKFYSPTATARPLSYRRWTANRCPRLPDLLYPVPSVQINVVRASRRPSIDHNIPSPSPNIAWTQHVSTKPRRVVIRSAREVPSGTSLVSSLGWRWSRRHTTDVHRTELEQYHTTNRHAAGQNMFSFTWQPTSAHTWHLPLVSRGAREVALGSRRTFYNKKKLTKTVKRDKKKARCRPQAKYGTQALSGRCHTCSPDTHALARDTAARIELRHRPHENRSRETKTGNPTKTHHD